MRSHNKLQLMFEALLIKKRSKYIISCILLFVLLYIFTRGVALNDEGYILHAAERIVQGELLFKDIFIAYTPVSPWITALGLFLFGNNLLAARFFALFASIISLILLYRITARYTKNEIYRYIPVLIFLVWGPMQINFSWPVVYATTFGLATCYFLLQPKDLAHNKYIYAGIVASLTLLSKQNFGIAVLIVCIGYFFIVKQNAVDNIMRFILGLLIPIILIAIYLSVFSLWPYAIENYYYYFYKKLILDGNQSTQFFYISSIKDIFKTILYLSPGIISFVCAYILYRKKKSVILLPLFTLSFYIFGIRPTTDYVHLIPLIALLGIPILLLILESKRVVIKRLLYIFSFLLLGIGLYTSLFRAYYRWEAPLITHTYSVNNHRINVQIDAKNYHTLNDTVSYIHSITAPNDYMFINYYLPTLYFAADRQNPTRFIYLSAHVVDDQYQNEIINNLKYKKVKLVVTSALLREEDTKITRYIKKNYQMIKTLHELDFWVNK